MIPPDPALDRRPRRGCWTLIDGLILAGGDDIDPASYGAAAAPRDHATVPTRDRFEIALARRAVERDMPLLGHLPRHAGAQRRLRRDAAAASS